MSSSKSENTQGVSFEFQNLQAATRVIEGLMLEGYKVSTKSMRPSGTGWLVAILDLVVDKESE